MTVNQIEAAVNTARSSTDSISLQLHDDPGLVLMLVILLSMVGFRAFILPKWNKCVA